MEKSKQYQEVLSLGKKISKELSLENSITLKWIGNYIATLILKVETEQDISKRNELEEECLMAILKLWDQRANSSSRIAPLRDYENVISVLNAIRNNEESFDWHKYENLNVPGSWGKFVKDIIKNYKDVIEIAICSASNSKYLNEGKDWLNHEKFLTKEESFIIEHLDHLLTQSEFPFGITLYGNDKSVKDRISKKQQVIDKLTKIIEDQNLALIKLKNAIEKMHDD